MKRVVALLTIAAGVAVWALVRVGARYERDAHALLTRHPSWVDEAYDAWDGERVLRLRPDPYVGRLH